MKRIGSLRSCLPVAPLAAASPVAAAVPSLDGAVLGPGLAGFVAALPDGQLLAAFGVLAVLLVFAAAALMRRATHSLRRRIRELDDAIAARDAQAESLARRLSQTIHELEVAHHRLHEQAIGLERKSHLDALTGLANRLLLDERIGHGIVRALRHNARMAVLMIELRGLAELAERCGRPVADEVRIAMAARLRGIVRAEDTVARLDDERFAAVLEEVYDRDDVQRVMAAAAEELGAAIPVGAERARLGVGLGYAFFPEDGRDAAALLASAANMIQAAAPDRRAVDVG